MAHAGRLQSTVIIAVSEQVALKLTFSVLAPSGIVMPVKTTSAPATVAVFALADPMKRSALVPSGWLVATCTSVLKPPVQEPPAEFAAVRLAPLAGEINDPVHTVVTSGFASLPPPPPAASEPESGRIWAFGLLSPQPARLPAAAIVRPARARATVIDERPNRFVVGIKSSRTQIGLNPKSRFVVRATSNRKTSSPNPHGSREPGHCNDSIDPRPVCVPARGSFRLCPDDSELPASIVLVLGCAIHGNIG